MDSPLSFYNLQAPPIPPELENLKLVDDLREEFLAGPLCTLAPPEDPRSTYLQVRDPLLGFGQGPPAGIHLEHRMGTSSASLIGVGIICLFWAPRLRMF